MIKKGDKFIRTSRNKNYYEFLIVRGYNPSKNKVKLTAPNGDKFANDLGWLLNGYRPDK